MEFENLQLDRDGAVAVLTVQRPKVLNALDRRTFDALDRAFHQLATDATVRVIVLTGEGDAAFVAGADIAEIAALSPAEAQAHAWRVQQVLTFIETMGKPVIAAINGFALGGGCELAMACTVRIAADTARLGLPEILLGTLPGFAGTQRLPRLVGRGMALDLLLTGRHIDAAEALRIGLVSRVVPAAALAASARALADQLAERAPAAVRALLQAVHAGCGDVEQGGALEAALFGVVATTPDMREGVTAFLEKRPARFSGS